MMRDILIVDDEADIRDLIADILIDEGFQTRTATDADSAFQEINARQPSLIILDIWLQGSRMDGIEVLKMVKRDNPDLPVVIISGHGNIEIAVAAIRQGAYDFIEKPFKTDQLLVVIGRALEASRLRHENADLRARDMQKAELIGPSHAIAQLRQTLDRVGATGSRVLFTGPAGAGKEVAARHLHKRSRRAEGPFIVVNAASIEPHQMEKALFGEERPGALPTQGLFEKAHGGVLFFDEITDMPLGTQSKILRMLIDQSFIRVGGESAVRVDLRVISATNRELAAEIAAGRFGEDLFHRLNVVPITVPSLAERREDIPDLVAHFIERLGREQGLPMRPISDDALATLQTHDWSGNVRQLKNIVEQMLIMARGEPGEPICTADLPEEIRSAGAVSAVQHVSANVVSLPLREAREVFEREYLITQINRFGGNISRTATFIGMERSALHRKLKTVGVATGGRGRGRVAYPQDAEEDE